MSNRRTAVDSRRAATRLSARRRIAVRLALVLLGGLVAASAHAQKAPPGYTQSRVGDVVEMRPDSESDGELAIRVFPPSSAGADPNRYLGEWASAHPPSGTLQTKTLPEPRIAQGVRVTGRQYRSGKRIVDEMIAAVPLRDGRLQIETTSVPSDRRDIQASIAAASGRVIAAIGRGEYLAGADASVPAASNAASAPSKATSSNQPTRPKADADVVRVEVRTPEGDFAPESPEQARARVLAAAGAIETVGFYTQTQMGVGGMLLFLPTPIVLFKDGVALLDISALKRMRSISEDRAAHPNRWIRWRREHGELQVERIKGWTKLDFQKTMDRLPADFKLSGDFQYMSGTGNTAIGGTSSVASWSTWSFDPDGTFSVNGGASATSEAKGAAGTTRVFSSSKSKSRGGRYSIDGYLLTVRDADGHDEVHVVVADPADLKVVWFDGDGYTRSDKK